MKTNGHAEHAEHADHDDNRVNANDHDNDVKDDHDDQQCLSGLMEASFLGHRALAPRHFWDQL